MVNINPKAGKLIDAYIAAAPAFARPICAKLRAIVHQADPSIVEDWKWGPNFHKKGMICGFGAAKAHVTFTFFKGSAMKDPRKILAGCRETNLHNRSIKFTDVSQIPVKVLGDYVREAVALNERGVKIELKRVPVRVPPELQKALGADTKAARNFESLSWGYRKEYAEYIAEAKQAETKQKRLKKALGLIAAGKTLNDRYR